MHTPEGFGHTAPGGEREEDQYELDFSEPGEHPAETSKEIPGPNSDLEHLSPEQLQAEITRLNALIPLLNRQSGGDEARDLEIRRDKAKELFEQR